MLFGEGENGACPTIIIIAIIVWRIDPLLGSDRETNNETTAVASQRTNELIGKRCFFWSVRVGGCSRNNGYKNLEQCFYTVCDK
jgi:hypothetical protein